MAATRIPDHDPDDATALIHAARCYGVGLWADGGELVVLEPWGRILPPMLFDELRQCAGAVIGGLRSESDTRVGDNWQAFDPPEP
jgi:hypothetical protein